MIIRKITWAVALIISLLVCFTTADLSVEINSKNALHRVSASFLSLSLDPKELLAGIDLSYNSLLLAQHLPPAYVRIAGPSTQNLQYFEEKAPHQSESMVHEKDGKLLVTPALFTALNDWLADSNLHPIFAINDAEKINGSWDPTPWIPVLELADKLNLSCYWQLGYDCSVKTEAAYSKDLQLLKNVLAQFPSSKDNWKIVGSDVSKCGYSMEKIAQSVQNSTFAIMWEPSMLTETTFPEKADLESANMYKTEVWTTAPKCNKSISFNSGLLWARQIGDASKIGYSVVFRQPTINEILSDTPTFWISVLHKKLMCRNVLDVSFPSGKNTGVFVYSHCAKPRDGNHKSGAIAVMIVNNEETSQTISLKSIGSSSKGVEIQIYELTALDNNAAETYLNGEKLTIEKLNDDAMLIPKIRKVNKASELSYDSPSKSVTFIVVPNAKAPACILDKGKSLNAGQKSAEDITDLNQKSTASRKIRDIKQYLIEKIRAGKQKRGYEELDFIDLDNNESKNDDIKRKTRRRAEEKNEDDSKTTTKSNTINKRKRYVTTDKNQKLIRIIRSRMKRDINMDLLKIKTENSRFPKRPPSIKNRLDSDPQDDKSIIVQPGYGPEESFESTTPSEQKTVTPKRIQHHNKHHAPTKQKHETNRRKPNEILRPSLRKDKEPHPDDEGLTDAMKFLAEADAAVSAQEDLRTYHNLHEQFGSSERLPYHKPTRNKELWEMNQRKAAPLKHPDNLEYDAMDDYSYLGNSAEYLRSILEENGADFLMDGDYMDFDTFPSSQDGYFRKKRQMMVPKNGKDGHGTVRKIRDAVLTSSYHPPGDQHRKDLTDSYYYILGKPFDPAKVKVNQAKKNRQLQHLRNRLQRKKATIEVKSRVYPKTDAAAAIANRKKIQARTGHRQKRSSYVDFKFPKIKHVYKEYVPKTKNVRAWKPADILQLKTNKLKKTSYIMKPHNWFSYKRNERDVFDSSENKIECSLNDIEKEISSEINFVHRALDETVNATETDGNKHLGEKSERVSANASPVTEKEEVEPTFSNEDGDAETFSVSCDSSWFEKMYTGVGNMLKSMTNQLKSLLRY